MLTASVSTPVRRGAEVRSPRWVRRRMRQTSSIWYPSACRDYSLGCNKKERVPGSRDCMAKFSAFPTSRRYTSPTLFAQPRDGSIHSTSWNRIFSEVREPPGRRLRPAWPDPVDWPPVMRAVVGVDRTPFWCLGSAAAEITRWRASLLGRAGSRGVPHPMGRSSWRRVPTGRRRRRRRSVARSPTGRGSPRTRPRRRGRGP